LSIDVDEEMLIDDLVEDGDEKKQLAKAAATSTRAKRSISLQENQLDHNWLPA
jgi:hypothetical protein